MSRKLFDRALLLVSAVVLPSCASIDSNWYLMSSGYTINPLDEDPQAYAIEVHVNQLKQLGGEINSAEFRRFVGERLMWHEICPGGWQPLPCVRAGSCVQHTSRSVTVTVRCVTP